MKSKSVEATVHQRVAKKKDRKIILSHLKDSIFFVHRVFSFLV